jgi:hypothetical protein
MNRSTYTLTSEPAGELYRALLQEAIASAAVGYLIVRRPGLTAILNAASDRRGGSGTR